ncbi:type I polyketide synthase [Priestia endophytica]|uniref:type I polyketide synthase n=1 Tax=Priestia endophytica TaxID=135735 RepID=UPI00124DC45B|nr:type I polyketide synthase [Priestia endophytica]KAB2495264.1 HAD-IIIC family phosphatase [Priestia endophytica]
MNNPTNHYHGAEIAVIGLAGRFPGAKNVEEYWENLKKGKETISFFTDEELRSDGTDEALLNNPRFVKAKGMLDDVDLFDADFFDYTPKEAAMMDPQFRLFHECVWTALEDAGYDPFEYKGQIGLYTGAGINTEWVMRALQGAVQGEDSKTLEAAVLNMRDYLATMISYKLNLKGPSMVVQTACSTSMVSIHLAVQALLSGDCHMAVAGGVSIRLPQKSGYLYQEGMIHSSDGHCRVFDNKADGTVFGDGAGAVILKNLEDAIEDGDHIYAIIKGSSINNDGNRKVGYTAPSTRGQVSAIKTALRMAEVEPETISYIEAHGTGTTLGDPIEIEALKQAFETDKRGFCRIGSVKSNVGHLNDASGVAGFIKTVLSLKHQVIPPTIHFDTPNEKINFEESPFVVNTELTPWKQQQIPRRAGVSSFGIGGTNAHVILEEAPKTSVAPDANTESEVLLLSAKTPTALEQMTENLADYLLQNQHVRLADVAYTLQIGRHHFPHKRVIIGDEISDILQAVNQKQKDVMKTASSQISSRPVVFLFPGQGSQYVDMGRQLYGKYPVFKEALDQCFERLKQHVSVDPFSILFSNESNHDQQLINQTEYTQPLLFSIEYALAKLMIHLGIKPQAMIGHSIGEYTAAAISGVLSLEDAVDLVAYRGQLIQQLPQGSMLSVSLSEKGIESYMTDDLSLAAANGPASCVVSGETQAIDSLSAQLEADGHSIRKLHTSHAFHSMMMDYILPSFKEKLATYSFGIPSIPYVSNVTGEWITDETAADPAYWADHLRQTVRFRDGAERLLTELNPIFIEVGPGNTLSAFVRQVSQEHHQQPIQLMRHPKEEASDDCYLLGRLGDIWLQGVPVDWSKLRDNKRYQKVSLPTYPFERQRYWIEKVDTAALSTSPSIQMVVPKEKNVQAKEETIHQQDVAMDDIETKLQHMWKDILGIEKVERDDHFFELGGHSLNATGLISQIHKEFGVELTLTDMFNNPTIEKLKTLIEKAEKNQYFQIEPVEPKETYQLSAAQRRTFLIHQRIGQVTSYNMPMALRCKGEIDVDRFEQTFKQLIQRHETLRTTFELKDGEPVQRVHDTFSFAVEMTSATEDELDAQIDEFIRPFDLKAAPLIRVRFVKIAKQDHLLLVDMHNIVADGASMNIFIKEFTELYRGETLPELTVQYKDYAEWQYKYFQSEMFQRQQDYWKHQIGTHVPTLTMPYDFERKKQSFLGKAIKFTIEPHIVEKIEQLGEAYQLTNNVILFQLYGLLLSRYADQEELIVGSLVAGRRHADIENTIGMFTNFLPIKLQMKQDAPLTEQLSQTKQVLLDAYDHQEYPFDQMVEHLNPKTRPHRNPFFDTMLIYHNEYDPNIKIEADGLIFETHEFAKGISKLDMKMDVVKEVTGELKCVLQYNLALFQHDTMQAFVQHFKSLVEQAAQAPEQLLKDFDVLSVEEERVAKEKRERAETQAPLLLTVSSTFTADPVAPYIQYWAKQFDLQVDVQFAPYGQVYQELLNENSLTSAKKNGANLLLVRLEDIVGPAHLSLEEKKRLVSEHAAELSKALKLKTKHNLYFVSILPISDAWQETLQSVEQDWIEQLSEIEGVQLIDCRALAQQYQLQDIFDLKGEQAAHLPFTESFFAAVGTRIARDIVAWQGTPFKVAAIDCDHTLWRGVISEDGVEGIEITPEHQALQIFLKQKQKEGLLLVLSSKNHEEDVWRVFEHHPDMILQKQDFVDWRINWEGKPDHLREMAEALNLSLSQFIFLDDDPAQCLRMNEEVPEVMTLLLPAEEKAIPLFVHHAWAFDRYDVTDEDRTRTTSYKAEKERKKEQVLAPTMERFLQDLNLKISVSEWTEHHLARIAQMSSRINQFRLNDRRFDEQQLRGQMQDHEVQGWIVEATDRFSHEGIVGAILANRTNELLKIEAFMLSCRALGKGIEQKLLTWLAEYCRQHNISSIDFSFKPTGRNQLFEAFMEEQMIQQTENNPQFRIHVKDVSALSKHIEIIETMSSLSDQYEDTAVSIVDEVLHPAAQAYTWETVLADQTMHIGFVKALQVHDEEGLRTLLRKENGEHDWLSAQPTNEREELLMKIWCDILHVEKVGIDNDFFDLGGNSLLAVKMEVEIEKKGWYVDDLKFAEKHTIRELAKYMKRENQHA